MVNIFCNLTFIDILRLSLLQNSKTTFFLDRSYLSKVIFSDDYLKKKGIQIFDWNFNDFRVQGMLLGYKVEIEYLNKFIIFLTENYLGNNENTYIKIYFKKKLLDFKIYKKIGLYQILLIFYIIHIKFDNCALFVPKNKYSYLINKFLKLNFSSITLINTNYLGYIINNISITLKSKIKMILSFFKLFYFSNNNIFNIADNKVSLEIALSSFNPKFIFNDINNKNLFLVNKIHKLSKKDKLNLKISKKNFIPLYDQNNKIYKLNSFFKRVQKDYVKKNDINKEFYREFKYWFEYFKLSKTKIYLTSYKYNSHIVPASHAINSLNGISCLFQTSFYETTKPYHAIYNDIYFSFSNNFNNAEKLVGSKIKYNVSVGYIYDYRFEQNKKRALEIKKIINRNGAKKIISFFDQGAVSDHKYSPGYYQTRESYEFILKKLIDNEWLGLIIKPKKPLLLKRSLGPIYNLLEKAIQTKRCHIFLDNHELIPKNFDNLPSEAAFASDVAIHNCLVAGTAGIEAALTKTYTVYFDYYGFKESVFYNPLNKNIVFDKWNILWDHILNYFDNNKNRSNTWDYVLKKIDPFNDGQAIKRLEYFTSSLLFSYSNGNDKEKIIEKTVNDYRNLWGHDKVLNIN